MKFSDHMDFDCAYHLQFFIKVVGLIVLERTIQVLCWKCEAVYS